jgi:hypothetical protein
MVRLFCILVAAVGCGVAFGAITAPANGQKANGEKTSDPPTAEKVAELRARGPEGLAEALRMYEVAQAEDRQAMFYCAAPPNPSERNQMAEWDAALDQVGGQRTCSVARLYWYTDLSEAKAEAERSGRPILSLRMLGKLTDEFSCANSRFFRTALYSNKEIGDFLRDNFVLHWQSVRPVPRVTIDFGDGRKLERTVTGNSAHYALASDGTVLDALPGLYSPQAFLKWLRATHDLDISYRRVAQARTEPRAVRAMLLKQFHTSRRDAILRDWDTDLQRLGEQQTSLVSSRINLAEESANRAQQTMQAAPSAKAAGNRAATKYVVERPLLRFAGYGGTLLEKGMDDDLWKSIATLHRSEVQLDDNSVAVMRNEYPRAAIAGAQSATKRQAEDPLLRVTSAFEESMALDAVRNEYLLHRRIHERLAESETGTVEFDALNEWVYAELFLTPSKDPWLGLAPADAYSALREDGRAEVAAQRATDDLFGQ